MARTVSIGSRVPPAFTTTRSPARLRGPSRRSASAASSRGSTMRPSPCQPQASSPASGPSRRTPRARSRSTFSRVAGWFHMWTFMAGATSTGARVASSRVVTRSSARPCAMRASRWAVAGATTTSSAQSASAMWSISPSSAASKSSLRTERPERVWSTSGETKRAASGVSTQRTSWPARRRARTSSGTL